MSIEEEIYLLGYHTGYKIKTNLPRACYPLHFFHRSRHLTCFVTPESHSCFFPLPPVNHYTSTNNYCFLKSISTAYLRYFSLHLAQNRAVHDKKFRLDFSLPLVFVLSWL